MINTKYKINLLAKDLGIKSKDMAQYLADSGITGKTSQATLEPHEFSALMNTITQANQTTDMGSYLNGTAKIRVKKAQPEAKNEPKATADNKNTEKKARTPEKSGAEKKENNKPVQQKEQPKNPAAKADNKTAEKPAPKQPVSPAPAEEKKVTPPPAPAHKSKQELQQEKQDRFRTAAQNQQNQQNQKPKNQKPAPQAKERPVNALFNGNNRPANTNTAERTSGEHVTKTRVVDTRSAGANVDLSKYDERLETFVDADRKKFQGNDNNKQKLKKQNNGKGGKSSASDKERQAMERLRKQEMEKKKKPLEITVPDEISVGELASRLKVTAAEVIKRLMMMGVMATVNQTIDYDTAYLVADELGAKVSKEVVVTIEDKLFDATEDSEDKLLPRAPVVCVMGHVDHGKTSLLDRIRNANVTAGEAGGITQHIGAYRVNVQGKDITFLDTPGHEAFTAMRARGAKSTDIAILVVAGDDGIMPQTVEAINHAKAAGIEIVVAINKMDKPTANAETVKQNLTQYNLVPEEWGGDTICVPVSAMTGMGIDDLLENVLLVAEMKQLTANPDRQAKGLVIEARLDKGRGPVATVLVQNGTLHSGDVVIAGTSVGRVRAMTNERGQILKTAGPSVPVEIIGLAEVPSAGDEFNAVSDERMARELAEQRKAKTKEEQFKSAGKVSLDDLFAQINDGIKELNIIVKADVGGSAEAVRASLEKLSNEEVKVKVIHSAAGGITEGDVMFAAASNAIIVGFNVRPDKTALDSAERQNVDIRTYRIIYDCINEITAAMKGMLAPTFKEELLGHAEVRQTIHVPGVGTIAGSYIQDGKITRKAQIRIVRDGVVIFEDKIASLKRFKDDAKEVAAGYECGVGLEKFNDIKIGDILEAFEMVEVER